MLPFSASEFAGLDTPELVRELLRQGRAERAVNFRLLPKDTAADVFDAFDPETSAELLADLGDDDVLEVLSSLDSGDQAVLLGEMPAGVANRVLQTLPDESRSRAQQLLGYPRESAGRRMDPHVVAVRASDPIAAAQQRIRHAIQTGEDIRDVPVYGANRVYLGLLSTGALLTAEPLSDDGQPRTVAQLQATQLSAHTDDDQEQAARTLRDAHVSILPVLDREGRVVGVLTVDDAMDILDEEESEDAAYAGGSMPVRRSYLSTSVWRLARARIVWLLVLLVAASLTVSVLDFFEESLHKVVALSLFIPLLIGTGGNTGAQAVTTVVRALSVGDVEFRDFMRIASREFRTGLMLGAILAAVAVIPAGLLVGFHIALVLAVSLLGICTLAATMGAIIPLVAHKVGVDPAVVSAPFITTIVDATGLIMYFLVAKAILGI